MTLDCETKNSTEPVKQNEKKWADPPSDDDGSVTRLVVQQEQLPKLRVHGIKSRAVFRQVERDLKEFGKIRNILHDARTAVRR